jgi:hypothetical protein
MMGSTKGEHAPRRERRAIASRFVARDRRRRRLAGGGTWEGSVATMEQHVTL